MQNKSSNTYSIILPTLNEAGHIDLLIKDIYNLFFDQNINFEIIIVDDGSNDGTIEKINKLKNEIKNLNLIVRTGQSSSLVNSLNAGIDLSKYENIVWLDADYSHPPQYMNEIIKKNNEEKYDLIFFSRFLNESKRYYDNQKYKKKIIDRLSLFLNNLCRFFLFNDLHDYTSGYISIKKKFVQKNKLKGYYGDYFMRLLVDAKINKLNIIELPFIELDRKSGISKTTGNKFGFMIKCFFYFISIISNFFRKFKVKQ